MSSAVGRGAAVIEPRTRSREGFKAGDSATVTSSRVLVEAGSESDLLPTSREKSAMRRTSTQPATITLTRRDWLESLRGGEFCGWPSFMRYAWSFHHN